MTVLFSFTEDDSPDSALSAFFKPRAEHRIFEQRFLPPMSQDAFINMWRTVYSFFALETDEEIFTSLSRVGECKLGNDFSSFLLYFDCASRTFM